MTENEVKEVPAQAEEPTTTPKQYDVGYGKSPKSTQFKPRPCVPFIRQRTARSMCLT